jgi:hypothetical protein
LTLIVGASWLQAVGVVAREILFSPTAHGYAGRERFSVAWGLSLCLPACAHSFSSLARLCPPAAARHRVVFEDLFCIIHQVRFGISFTCSVAARPQPFSALVCPWDETTPACVL